MSAMGSNKKARWYQTEEHALAMRLTLIIVGALICVVVVGFFVGSRFEGFQESGFFHDRMNFIERAGNIDNLIEQEKQFGKPEFIPEDGPGPHRERIGLRNVVIVDAQGKTIIFGFLANTKFTLPNLASESSQILSIDNNNVMFYRFDVEGKKLYFYENVDLLNRFRSNVLFGSVLAILSFGFVLYFIALWIAKKTIEPIRKSEEYARSYNHHIAHELKTPLTIIKSDLDLAIKSPKTAETHIESAIEETIQMRKTIDNLLFLAEQEINKKIESISLSSEFDYILKEVQKMHSGKKIQFDTESIENMQISGDLGLVRVLLRNIVENIYKYAKTGTKAAIENKDKVLIFSNISETPITPIQLQTVLEPFVGTPGNGHGLGLSIVKRICDIHGWKVSVECTDNQFCLKIIIG